MILSWSEERSHSNQQRVNQGLSYQVDIYWLCAFDFLIVSKNMFANSSTSLKST